MVDFNTKEPRSARGKAGYSSVKPAVSNIKNCQRTAMAVPGKEADIN
jgi:hypothetical protein